MKKSFQVVLGFSVAYVSSLFYVAHASAASSIFNPDGTVNVPYTGAQVYDYSCAQVAVANGGSNWYEMGGCVGQDQAHLPWTSLGLSHPLSYYPSTARLQFVNYYLWYGDGWQCYQSPNNMSGSCGYGDNVYMSGDYFSNAPVPPPPPTLITEYLTQFPVLTAGLLNGITSGPGALWFLEEQANNVGRITTTGAITEYPIPTTASNPVAIVAGPDGALWFTEYDGNNIGRITTTGVITEYSGAGVPVGITVGPDGALWFNDSTGSIGRTTTAGAMTKYPVPDYVPATMGSVTITPTWGSPGYVQSGSVAVNDFSPSPVVFNTITMSQPTYCDWNPIGCPGVDNVLYLYDASINNLIAIFTPLNSLGLGSYGTLTWTSSTTVSVAANSGAYFELQGGPNYIGATQGGYAIVAEGMNLNPYPGGITVGPDGALWFTEGETNSIGRITTDGVISEFPVDGVPLAITTGPDGALWFTEQIGAAVIAGGNNIGRITTSGATTDYPIPTPTAAASMLTTGPDGALWFAELPANQIGRITTAGLITEFAMPSANSGPYAITAGPDNNLWFTEYSADNIAQVSPAGLACLSSPANCGTISVATNLDAATFTITGAVGFSGSGTSATFSNAPSGAYSITFGAVPGYTTPTASPQTLAAGGTITFTGNYISAPPSLVIAPAALSFTYRQGSTAPQSQNLSVSSTGAALAIAATVTTTPTGGTWLSVSPDSATTPATFVVSVSAGLAAGTYTGQVTIASAGAANSPQTVPVTLTVGPFSMTLVFPIRSDKARCTASNGACTPLNANISAVFDHNQKVPYAKGDVITAYTGETGACNGSGSNPYQQIHSPFGKKGHSGFAQANGQAFVLNGNYYIKGETTGTAACGSTTITGSASENLYLFYDGHPGYDYPFNFGKSVFPAVSGCISYQINAAGPNGGYSQAQAHTVAIVPMATAPPGGTCPQPYTSKTGIVVVYMHLSSYLDGSTIMVCPAAPNAPGTTTATCPNATVCSTCPAEGKWVSSDPSITTQPIAHVGNFFSGLWGGVPTHLHFEVDLSPGPLPSSTAKPIPLDPYGWNPNAGLDPYLTSHPGIVNTWLWRQSSPY